MAMVVVVLEMEMEIGSETTAVVDGFFFSLSPRFSSRGVSLYLGAFTKVVLFDDTMAAATIRVDQNGPAV